MLLAQIMVGGSIMQATEQPEELHAQTLGERSVVLVLILPFSLVDGRVPNTVSRCEQQGRGEQEYGDFGKVEDFEKAGCDEDDPQQKH